MSHHTSIKKLGWMFSALCLVALGTGAYVLIQDKHLHAADESEAKAETAHTEEDGHAHETAGHDGHGAEEAGAAAAAETETDEAGVHAHEAAEEEGHNHAAEGGEGHMDEAVLTPEAIQQNGIRVEPALKHALGQVLTVPGRISYNMEQMAHVGTPVQGRVAEVRVKLGDPVKKDDTLVIIDSPALGEAQSDFLQKRTLVEVASANMEVAQTAAERAKRLLEGKGIALGEYQRREGEYKAALGAQKAARAALTAAENTLRLYGATADDLKRLSATGEVDPHFAIRAPIDGQVIEREITLGEVVGPEREALLILADMSTLWVLAEVPENQIRQIALKAPATVSAEALADETLQGTVAYIAPELNKETRTAQVRIEVAGGAATVSPGMFAQVSLLCGSSPEQSPAETLAVPDAAVQMFEGGPTVFAAVPDEPGAFVARRVEVGPSNGTLIPILSGLEEGTPVVVEGAFIIKAEIAKGIMEGKTCSGH